MNDDLFKKIFSEQNFQQPFFGSFEAFNKAWQETLQKTQTGFTQPSVTIEELDKRIEALKNVENWLNLNLSMVKNTIQGFELQRTNLQSLQEMMQQKEVLQAAGQQWWQSLQEQFNQFLQTHTQQVQQTTADILKTADNTANVMKTMATASTQAEETSHAPHATAKPVAKKTTARTSNSSTTKTKRASKKTQIATTSETGVKLARKIARKKG